MNPLDGDMEFQRRKAHEERRAVIENALRARGFTPEDAQIYVSEYTAGVLQQAVDMTCDLPEPDVGWFFRKGRRHWRYSGLREARSAIQRLEQWENRRIHHLIKAKHQKEDERP